MENIYAQSDLERYSIAEIPDGFAANSGNLLHSWLGSLWNGLNKGDGMVRGLQAARGERLAQMYIDILEAVHLQDRNNAPVFHRDLWHPITVRLSRRDTSQENMLKIGGAAILGPQRDEDPYGEGTVLEIGKMGAFSRYVTYPLDIDIAGGAVSIVDNIINPRVTLQAEKDFWIRNKSVIFLRENDPLGSGSAFEKIDIPGTVDEKGELVSDMEAVLWASDVLIDRNYVADHLSYALGANAPSSDVVKRILNAAWSSVTSGLTPELLKTLIAAMLNVPVIQDDKETVESVMKKDGATVVMTDRHAYRISPKATLRKEVKEGATLRRGDLLDESVRIYPFLNAITQSPMSETDQRTGFSVPLEQDIPSIVLSPSIIKAKTEYGVYSTWKSAKVKAQIGSPLDEEGDPRHLYFDVGGTEEDVEAFWKGIWDDADRKGISLKKIIGHERQEISPAGFMVRHLVGANTLFVVVDKSQVDDTSMMRDPMFFDMLSSVVPSAMRLFLVEHDAVGDDDKMDLGQAEEGGFVAAALPEAVDVMDGAEPPWIKGRGPSFGEWISARFVRLPPAKVRGVKEDEDENK